MLFDLFKGMRFQMQLKHFKSLSLSIFLTGATLFASPTTSLAQQRCGGVFEALTYGQLQPDFEHDTAYTKELSEQSEVKDQCGLGTCHLHAWVSSLEHDYMAKTGMPLKLSMEYLTSRLWLKKSFEVLDQKDNSLEVSLGANSFTSRRFINEAGLIPDSAWKATNPFQESPLSKKLETYISNIIARTKLARDHEVNSEKRKEIIEQGKMQIAHLFRNVIGTPPETFEFNGKVYTPETFAFSLFPQLSRQIISLRLNNTSNAKTHFLEETVASKMIQTSDQNVEMVIRNLIDHGQNIYLAYDHQAAYVDKKTGIMSIAAFATPPGGAPLSHAQSENFSIEEHGHGVLIVGYKLDPTTGRITQLKIKGSWGEESGDHGYYHMYADYFHRFGRSISFFNYPFIKLPEIDSAEPLQYQLFPNH